MKRTASLMAAALCLGAWASGALATDTPAPGTEPAQAAAEEPIGPPLDSICNACGVVAALRSEHRKIYPKVNATPSVVTGAVAGAVVGHVAGRGKSGPTVTGAVVGAAAANEAAKRNAEPRLLTVWTALVTLKDGTQRSYELDSDPGFKPGDVVRIFNGLPYKMR